MLTEIICDFESRSRLSLRHTNVYKYARHPSTQALCMSWETDDFEGLWRIGDPYPFERFEELQILSFNAEFEYAIWQYVCTRSEYDWPEMPADRFDCLQARASYAGLPRKLELVSPALGLRKLGKDMEGHKITLRLCRPQRAKGHGTPKLVGCEFVGGAFDESPEKHLRNERYCVQDSVTEGMVDRLCPPLPPAERKLWLVHQRINARGVPVDLSLCRNATQMVEWEKERLCGELFELTGKRVRTPNCLDKFKAWLGSAGCKLDDMQEETILAALKSGGISKPVERALTIRTLYRDASVAKYAAAVNHAEDDGCCRAAHVFYKAGPGRFAGAGVNFLNMRRLVKKDIDSNVALADEIADASGDPLRSIYDRLRDTDKGVIPTLGLMSRMMICARPGKKLVVCDYSSIEMRMLHWLAGDEQTLKQIRDFDNGVGEEPYRIYGAMIYGKQVKDVTDDERQIGKVFSLGCGYLSGAATFSAFCAGYEIDMPLDRAQELVQLYRRSFPLVKKFWYDLGKAATRAVRTRRRTEVGPIEFYMTGHTLNARLPSGRELKYYGAKVVDGVYGEEIEALDQRSGRRKAVGLPILVENVDQAASRDLLGDNLIKCDRERLPIVLHVYDEDVMETDEEDDKSALLLREIMRNVPKWAGGLPVDAKPGESRRYTK